MATHNNWKSAEPTTCVHTTMENNKFSKYKGQMLICVDVNIKGNLASASQRFLQRQDKWIMRKCRRILSHKEH